MSKHSHATDEELVAAVARQLDDATVDEAAAVAGAIATHLSDRERAAAAAAAQSEDGGPAWEGREWTLAGKLARNRRTARRVPRDAPADAWSAAGRSDRF